jgi:hypothetical protein
MEGKGRIVADNEQPCKSAGSASKSQVPTAEEDDQESNQLSNSNLLDNYSQSTE